MGSSLVGSPDSLDSVRTGKRMVPKVQDANFPRFFWEKTWFLKIGFGMQTLNHVWLSVRLYNIIAEHMTN